MNKASVDILINGRAVRLYGHENKTFVEAKDGSLYSIKVKNNRAARVLAVVTVDGLNVIDGQPASSDGPGYVVEAYSSYDIQGFRVSDSQVNAFKFSTKDKSYAANNESNGFSDQNCGAIGVIIYAEKAKPKFDWNKIKPAPIVIPQPYPVPVPVPRPRPWRDPYDPWYDPNPYRPTIICKSTTDASGAASMSRMMNVVSNDTQSRSVANNSLSFNSSAAPAEFDMGTEFSDKEVSDKVETTQFVRARKVEESTIYYASRNVLEKLGVVFDKTATVSFPDAFPRDTGYCKPPTKR